MPDQTPEPGPDEEQTASGRTGPRFAWVPGSADTGLAPVPGSEPGPAPADVAPGGVLPQGLDYQALLEALADSGLLAGEEDDQDAVLAEELQAAADGRMQPLDPGPLAALAAEHMSPGHAQAGWLSVAAAAAESLDENALAGMAIASRQLASWAQAAELAACAQISARAAAADPRIGLEADGRPVRLGRDALGQISLALMLTGYSAGAWADLAVTLAWRLRATGTALGAGVIDLARAQAIAEADPAVPWRVIVTNPAGQAIAVSRIRRRSRADPPRESTCRDGPAHGSYGRDDQGRDHRDLARDGPPGTGLVGRVTVTISQDTITSAAQHAVGPGPPAGTGPPAATSPAATATPPGAITAAALRAATQALDRAVAQAHVDEQAGGCAHTGESPAYRPPPRLREFVIARDVTCRKPTCRQPAWRADLDHTHPYDQDGRTCGCNLGGACRSHHQLKQHPRWKLEQTKPGQFTWTTPAGRTYTTTPDTYLA